MAGADHPVATTELTGALDAVGAALSAGRVDQAMDRANRALARGLEHPLILHLAADRQSVAGNLGAARSLLERAVALAPSNPDIRLAYGQCLARLGQAPAAVAAFDAALLLRPGFAPAQFAKGQVLEQSGELEAARDCYEAAAKAPNYPEPLAALAYIAVGAGKVEEARTLAARALRVAPTYSAPRATLAAAHILKREFDQAEAELRAMLGDQAGSSPNRGALLKLLGDALHGQSRFDEAAEAYASGGTALLALYRASSPGGEGAALAQARRLFSDFTSLDPDRWADQPDTARRPDAPVVRHIFLVGFPRSGTTLLEQALARHPDVVGLEERPTLADPINRLVTDRAALERLTAMRSDELQRLRALYWDRARHFAAAELDGKVLIDKMPLNTLLLPVIARLFPDARVLFALRDPRDVVLSCFRQRFLLTPAMAEFTALGTAARYYDAVMTLGCAYRDKLPLRVHTHRYEDMVEDFDAAITKVLDFIGLDWRPQVRDFATPRGPGLINTPSASQVSRGLYAQGIGQWRNYERVLTPVLPILDPWVGRFGYSAD